MTILSQYLLLVLVKWEFKGDFVVEYVGNFISLEEANERERQYTTNNEGCFLLHFGAKTVVDATRTYGRFGRLVNNASTNANLVPRAPVLYKGQQRLVLVALQSIHQREELSFDYGIR